MLDKTTTTTTLPSTALVVYFRRGWKKILPDDSLPKIHLLENVTVKFIDSWDELAPAIKLEPAQIIFHADVVVQSGQSVDTVISMVETTAKLVLPNKVIPLSIAIDKSTTREQITEFKKANLTGIVPSISAFGMEESLTAVTKLIAGETYWPERIISELPASPKSLLPRVVSFRTAKQEQWTTTIQHSIKDNGKYQIEFCTHWDDFTDSISEPTDLVLFHCKMLALDKVSAAEVVNMLSTLTHYTTGNIAKIAVVIDKDTPVEMIKQLRKTEVCGVVPSSEQWGTVVGNAAVVALLEEGSYWPKDIIAELPGAPVDQTPKKKGALSLTVRQQQVLTLVCNRGLSNKQIANTLKIAESTVKIHVSAVMKTYGVRNRTQLAVSASAGLKA